MQEYIKIGVSTMQEMQQWQRQVAKKMYPGVYLSERYTYRLIFDYLSQVSTNSPACWNLLGRSDFFWHHQTRDTRTHTVFIVHYVLHIDTFKSHEDSPTSNWCTCTAMSAALLCIFPLYIFLVQLWSPASSFACFCMCWVGEFQGQSKMVFNSVHCNT